MSLFQALQARKARILFVCLGNSVRSQMAEAFAKVHGGDVAETASAGLTPAPKVAGKAVIAMQEKGISLAGKFPRGMSAVDLSSFDLVINMSGFALPKVPGVELTMTIKDPMGRDLTEYRRVRDEIEQAVRDLVAHLRSARQVPRPMVMGTAVRKPDAAITATAAR
ncbi:MAG: hypothetical protein ABI823_15665 [Bryobacteraceae bacterium]